MKKILEPEFVRQVKIVLFLPALLLSLFFIHEFYDDQKELIKAQNKTNLKIETVLIEIGTLKDRIKSQESLTKQFYKWQLDKHASKNEENYEKDN